MINENAATHKNPRQNKMREIQTNIESPDPEDVSLLLGKFFSGFAYCIMVCFFPLLRGEYT
jgi:hypothetical protein